MKTIKINIDIYLRIDDNQIKIKPPSEKKKHPGGGGGGGGAQKKI
jgi:hypothetical protein